MTMVLSAGHTVGIANAPDARNHLSALVQHLHLLVHWYESSAVCLRADRLQVQTLRIPPATAFCTSVFKEIMVY